MWSYVSLCSVCNGYWQQCTLMIWNDFWWSQNVSFLQPQRVFIVCRWWMANCNCPLTAACILSFHLNITKKSSPNYVNLWNIQYPTQEPKDISPSSTAPWSTSETANELVRFILLFMLWTVYYITCILYRVFLLYHMPILFILCSLCFTSPASWLP